MRVASFALSMVLFSVLLSNAQTDIGGVVNTYTSVTAITNCACPSINCNSVTVVSAAGFSVGDKVIIMQMKGAQVDTTNSASHGSILNLYDAGNYEFASISAIASNVITTSYPLKETYFSGPYSADSAYVQMIRVAVYSGNVNVTSTLRPQTWSQTTKTGGVLAIELDGTLTLQANISADSTGYRGARLATFAVSCGYDTAFYYQSTIANHSNCTSCGYAYAETRNSSIASYGGCSAPCATTRMDAEDPRIAGFRGEGVAANYFKKTFSSGPIPQAPFDKGKGRWGNGGGGGSNHNAGGGGGGNYGAGGFGGNMYNVVSSGCPSAGFSTRRGYGGAALTPTGSKLFMGGGGGEGHNNGGGGTTGTAGGGIIFITAATIANSASYTISANGLDIPTIATNDGSGGGGAGGTILMEVADGFLQAVTISAKGGKGGDHSQSSCHGTGAGGGGGVVWFSEGSLPANATAVVTGGANGQNVHAGFDCVDRNWGATAGSAGGTSFGNAAGAEYFLNTNTCSSPLPVQLVSFGATAGEKDILVRWSVASQMNLVYFRVEKSIDALSFAELTTINADGNSTSLKDYFTNDNFPVNGKNYYRLAQVDINGKTTYSQTVLVEFKLKESDINIFPNPAKAFFTVSVSDEVVFDLSVTDMEGKLYANFSQLSGKARIESRNFPAGIYLLKIISLNKVFYKKVVINN